MTSPAESTHSVRFPGESDEYRAARSDLLKAEIDLRRAAESVNRQRRALPLGGEVAEDYLFEEAVAKGDSSEVGEVRMSELFSPGKDTLVLYSFMYGPEMKEACPSCTSILDAMDAEARHITQRVNFAVVGKSPVLRLTAHARKRGWRDLRLLSSGRSTYNHDYQGEDAAGNQTPILNVFARRDGRIYHTYATELLFASPDPGQDPRHVDMIWPLWNLLDLTPDGRGEKWNPRLSYEAQ